ncbi:GNAT family N-acetyltransferase [Novosphingobium sp.]|uniref:GNAT family N-acetyltransferase n=1 Tax=Novosphingobium sp. TaxID=1874826 RepID=UPI003B51A981
MTEMTITHELISAGIVGSGGEFIATLPGEEATGKLTYVTRGDVLVAEHTLVPSSIGGRGVAAALVEALVAHARAENLKIDPQCSYVAEAFKRHPDWADLLA